MGREVESKHGPGIVGVIGQENARYHAFTHSLTGLETPKGCGSAFGLSYDVSINSNECIRVMLTAAKFEWVWIMDDDHVFPSNTLLKLLDAQVDLIVPLYVQRKSPFAPCIYGEEPEENRYRNFTWPQLAGKSGVIPVMSAGKGGVLIRRHVIEAMRPPWFERPAQTGEDHFFFKKARQLGFQLSCHLDATIGHITPHIIRAKRARDGTWHPSVDLGARLEIDLFPFAAEQPGS
jgi:hypothetical protein